MTCTQFRNVLDAYVDGELADEANAAADAHRRGCPGCDRLVAQVLALQHGVRARTAAIEVPAGLDARVGQAVRTASAPAGWLRQVRDRPGWRAALAAAAVLLLVALAWTNRDIRAGTADVADRLAVHLDDNREVVLQGTIRCRDCELEHRYGVEAHCPRIGHHGALETADGHIWNLVEQPVSESLIHDRALLGRRVEVRGRIFRGARTLVVERFAFKS